MMRRLSVVLFACVLAACQHPAETAAADTFDAKAGADARRIESDVRFLADDLLEGREAGTRGHELAAVYVAQRLRAIGLAPAGDDGSYYQRVPMLRASRVADGGQLVVTRNGASTALRFREQFLPALNFNGADMAVTAPAVFIGQGVHAPELGHDDFRGIDVRGRIAVLFAGAPATFDIDRHAFHASSDEKLRELSARGAVGAVFVDSDADEARMPWSRAMQTWDRAGMCLRGADGNGIDTFPQLRVVAHVSAAAAGVLLSGEGRSAAQLFQAAMDDRLPSFRLAGTITLAARTLVTSVESRNVVAKLPGGNAVMARERVLVSAHLDHLGTGAPVNGDRIYNGALDNALGVAIMIEAARISAAVPAIPRRTVVFAAFTAEEQGLLGSKWFARQADTAAGPVVADINLDMPMLLTPTDDIVAVGLQHSSLAHEVSQAARDIGVDLSSDPLPEQSVFVRSDQYAFIRAGIPSVYLMGGIQASASRDDASATVQAYLKERYHQRGDDVSQTIQYPDAARLARVSARVAGLVADAPVRPQWRGADFFGQQFGSGPATAR